MEAPLAVEFLCAFVEPLAEAGRPASQVGHMVFDYVLKTFDADREEIIVIYSREID